MTSTKVEVTGADDPAQPTGEATASIAQPAAAPGDDPCAPGPVKEPYRWYPALDLARIPFHSGSGPWGKADPIVAPEPPVVRRKVTVHNARELGEAAKVKGSEITIGSSIDETVGFMGDVVDIDLVVPEGKYVRYLIIGSHTPPSRTQRVRIRGPKPGEHSGGRVGALFFLSEQADDVILDGIDLNGDDGEGGRGLIEFRAGDRVAIVNVRGRAPGWGALFQRDVRNLVMAGSHLMTGQRSRAKNGFPEGWGMRGGDKVVYFRNRFEGTRYHLLRVQPAHALQYAWIAENVFVDPHEARILSAMLVSDSPPGAQFDGLWAQCNEVYAHSSCMLASMEAPMAAYSRITHNRFHGSFKESDQRTQQDAAQGDHDYLTASTYGPWKTPPPAPKAPGDAREVPLPPDDPKDDNPGFTGPDCPAP